MARLGGYLGVPSGAANLCTKILDFRGFDSRMITILRGEHLRSIRDFPESLSQQILVGRILVRRLCVAVRQGALGVHKGSQGCAGVRGSI